LGRSIQNFREFQYGNTNVQKEAELLTVQGLFRHLGWQRLILFL
jgi:hypothetical protein